MSGGRAPTDMAMSRTAGTPEVVPDAEHGAPNFRMSFDCRIGDKDIQQRGEAHEGRSSWVGSTSQTPVARSQRVDQQFRSGRVPLLLRGDQAVGDEPLERGPRRR